MYIRLIFVCRRHVRARQSCGEFETKMAAASRLHAYVWYEFDKTAFLNLFFFKLVIRLSEFVRHCLLCLLIDME